MFQIKTDIRQYKCDDHQTVEALIRNWVIRPNDLIYIVEDNRWAPIGQHPDFEDIFAQLADTNEAYDTGEELLSRALDAATNLLDESSDVLVREPVSVDENEITHVSGLRALKSATNNHLHASESYDQSVTRDSEEITTITPRTKELIVAGNIGDTDELSVIDGVTGQVEDLRETAEFFVDKSRNPSRSDVEQELLQTAEFERSDDDFGKADDDDADIFAEFDVDPLRDTDELTTDEAKTVRQWKANLTEHDQREVEQTLDDNHLPISHTELTQGSDANNDSPPPEKTDIAQLESDDDEVISAENISGGSIEDVRFDTVASDAGVDEPRKSVTPPPMPSAVVKDGDIISGGYEIPLPFIIDPWPQLSVPKVSEAKKEQAFPYPQPKRKNNVVTKALLLDGMASLPAIKSPPQSTPTPKTSPNFIPGLYLLGIGVVIVLVIIVLAMK